MVRCDETLWFVDQSHRPDVRVICVTCGDLTHREAIENRRLLGQPDPIAWLWQIVKRMQTEFEEAKSLEPSRAAVAIRH